MKNWFTVTIQSCKMQDLPKYTEVFNLAEIPETICVKLPDSLPRDMELSGIFDLTNNKEVEFEDYVIRNEFRPWLDIQNTILDMTPGQHTYRLTFTRLGIYVNAICWFSYIIQDDFVEKPYVYMKRDDEESSEGGN